MTRHCLYSALYILALTLAFSSCDSEDYYDESGSSNCYIGSATLGTLNRILHTTVTNTDGTTKDSAYIGTLTGAKYPLSIDHAAGRIFNLDSLPYETDVAHVTFADMSGTSTILIRKLMVEDDTVFSISDSTNCIVPRQLTVYSPDYTHTRKYQLDIRVHREVGDSTKWSQLANNVSIVTDLTEQRALVCNEQIYLFAKENGSTPVVLTASTDDAANLQRNEISMADIETHNVVLLQNKFYALASGKLVESTDGINWDYTATSATEPFDALLAAGSQQLVARQGDKLLGSKDGGQTWEEEALEAGGKLPLDEAYGLCFPSETDAQYEDLILVGYHNNEPTIWKKNIDNSGTDQYDWNYYTLATAADTRLPLLTATSLLAYDKGLLMVGVDSDHQPSALYYSKDGGLHWSSTTIPQPKLADGTTGYVGAVDENNFIYLFCNGSGAVYRGRLNRLGWEDISYSYEE